MVRVVQTGRADGLGSAVLRPVAAVKRCKGCGEAIGPLQRWCSVACQRAEDPEYRDDDDYDRMEY